MTSFRRLGLCLSVAIAAVARIASGAPAEKLHVAVPGGQVLDLDAAAIAALPHEESQAVDSHGRGGLFRGVPLTEVLRRAGAASEAIRGSHLRDVVRVECADGYVVVFALAELDSALGARKVLLADAREGKPLGAEEGTWRLVMPDEKRPASWTRQVVSIRVLTVD